ncbi:MAG: hypothetical protein IJT60_04860 [Clostridia bacterium]|nr:hypothetical protein [Clostridia bacterium]
MTRTYRIVELNISVTTVGVGVHDLCKDYLIASGKPDLVVQTGRADIDFERDRSIQSYKALGQTVPPLSDDLLEMSAVCRQVAEQMPFQGTILVHGSCIAVDGAGYLFTADSGTGKSTHAALWRQVFGERVVMVNDDKPLIRIQDGGAVAFGTPWDGKDRLSTNISVPLKAICILERGLRNEIRPLSVEEAYPVLVRQVYRPMDGAALEKTLELIDRLASLVKLWHLSCTMDPEAARVASQAMMKG